VIRGQWSRGGAHWGLKKGGGEVTKGNKRKRF
jgi:hypothetical protein